MDITIPRRCGLPKFFSMKSLLIHRKRFDSFIVSFTFVKNYGKFCLFLYGYGPPYSIKMISLFSVQEYPLPLSEALPEIVMHLIHRDADNINHRIGACSPRMEGGYRFPVAYITADNTHNGAVSQRRIRSPRCTSCIPAFLAASASDGSKPPSLPTTTAI